MYILAAHVSTVASAKRRNFCIHVHTDSHASFLSYINGIAIAVVLYSLQLYVAILIDLFVQYCSHTQSTVN